MQNHIFNSFANDCNVAVIGANGGIGRALVTEIQKQPCVDKIFCCSREQGEIDVNKTTFIKLNVADDNSIASAADEIKSKTNKIDVIIVATGILHEGDALRPEKSWRSLNTENLIKIFQINTIGPAIIAKHFIEFLPTDRKCIFAALSARVGSIEDNHIGGWYGYRSSKAALNMMIKSLSIELSRKNSQAIAVTLHPGTVDTSLSKPFQSAVPNNKLFTPSISASHILKVIDRLQPIASGGLFAWDGERIPF